MCVCLVSWAGKYNFGANAQLPQVPKLMGCIMRCLVYFTLGWTCLSFSSLPFPFPLSLSCLIFLSLVLSPPPFLPSGSWCGIASSFVLLSFPAFSPVLGFLPRLTLLYLDAVVWLELRAAVQYKGEVRRSGHVLCESPVIALLEHQSRSHWGPNGLLCILGFIFCFGSLISMNPSIFGQCSRLGWSFHKTWGQ